MTIVQLAGHTVCPCIDIYYPKAAMMKSSRIIEQYTKESGFILGSSHAFA